METFDYIIVGAGSAGCVLANRLTAGGQHSVLLLEAGGEDSNFWIHVPLGYGRHFTDPDLNWLYQSEPQIECHGRAIIQPRGKVLGGSSSINGLLYIRGQAEDFGRWRQLGNAGWSYDDVLPYFKRSENNGDFDGEYHGKDGPLHVNRLRSDNPVHDIFHQAAREAQFRIREDFNEADHEGLGSYQVTQHRGERWSAARAYLQPHMDKRANLR